MVKRIINFIKSFNPYHNLDKNNRIYIVLKGKKYQLKRRIPGLDIKFQGNNNLVELHLPINIGNLKLLFEGNNGSFIMMPTNQIVRNTQISIDSYGHVFIDSNIELNRPNVHIIVNNNAKDKPHKLYIGKNAQISSDLLIRTSDGHSLFNGDEKLPYNEPQDIIIGDNVWIGSRVMITKGAVIPNNTVVGACSLVNKKFNEEYTIIGGNPAKVLKRNIRWQKEPYEYFMNKYNNVQTPTTHQSEKSRIRKYLKRKLQNLRIKSFI